MLHFIIDFTRKKRETKTLVRNRHKSANREENAFNENNLTTTDGFT